MEGVIGRIRVTKDGVPLNLKVESDGFGYYRASDRDDIWYAKCHTSPASSDKMPQNADVVWSLVVREDYRSLGIGGAFTKIVADDVVSGGLECWLYCYAELVPFYESIGFRSECKLGEITHAMRYVT